VRDPLHHLVDAVVIDLGVMAHHFIDVMENLFS
jgi:hypothetical protein